MVFVFLELLYNRFFAYLLVIFCIFWCFLFGGWTAFLLLVFFSVLFSFLSFSLFLPSTRLSLWNALPSLRFSSHRAVQTATRPDCVQR